MDGGKEGQVRESRTKGRGNEKKGRQFRREKMLSLALHLDSREHCRHVDPDSHKGDHLLEQLPPSFISAGSSEERDEIRRDEMKRGEDTNAAGRTAKLTGMGR